MCLLVYRSIGDVNAFLQQLTTQRSSMPRKVSRTAGRWGPSTAGRPNDCDDVPLYRLVNRSGLRVSYWAR